MLKIGDLLIYNNMYEDEEFGIIVSVERQDSKKKAKVVEVYWFLEGETTTEVADTIESDDMEYEYIKVYSRA
jgi:hypothetical protein|tara:strand:- start:60 stop:275 length:216 start_codon:yes stop_codon:yes gene_type:complete